MILELELIPAYVPPPGEFLKMELEARGWTQEKLEAQVTVTQGK